MKILLYTHLTEEFPNYIVEIKDKFKEHQFVCARTKEEYEEEVKDSHILVYGNPSDQILNEAENLELLIVPYAGVSQLNRNLLESRKIRVSNSHGNSLAVAERALSLAMACCGRVVEFHNDMKEGNWHRTGNPHKPFDYWYSINGKRISILGMGSIGQRLAKLLSGFDCKLMGFRKSNQNIPMYFDSVTNNLKEALTYGDIIFAALPSTSTTENMINGKKIKLLEGKYIINVGRGSLLEEEPFFKALESGYIAGAGIDAWYDYPSKENPKATGSKLPFHSLPNVVMSPHAASHAPEGKLGQLTGALEVIDTYLSEGKVLNEILGHY